MKFSAIGKSVVTLFCLGIISTVVSAQSETIDTDRILHSTVYIMQARNDGNNLFITCVGSGSLVSRDGLILTNAHIVLTSDTCPGDVLIVSLTTDTTEPPVARYRADAVQIDTGLDIALIRINRNLDGSLVDRTTMALPFVELADSSAARLDETITIVGYPGLGNDSVTAIPATLAGFISEPRSLNLGPAWLKTNSSVPATMSGGGAYNQNSQLVGIPTTAPVSRNLSQSATCIALQDTNNDDLINSDDQCIPVGESINALRPSNFARTLLRGSALGLNVNIQSAISVSPSSPPPSSINRMFFAASVNEAGMPTTVISSLPAGSTSLYLFFDYQNMTSETAYELRVTTDNTLNTIFGLAPVRWSGGQQGMWYIGSSGQVLPNGIYQFTLLADGIELSSKRLIIGEAPTTISGFSDIVFGLLDSRGNPQGNGFVLPSGNIASARFIYRNMQDGMRWAAVWYLNETEFQRVSNLWDAGANGAQTTSIEVPQGLPSGRYRLELYIEDRLAATSDFTVSGAQNGALAQIFTNLYSTTADTDTEALTALPVSNLPNTISNLYVLFDWQKIAPGTIWTFQWLVDGEVFFEYTAPWNNTSDGTHFIAHLYGSDLIPDGTYTMNLLVNNLKLASLTTQVGIGQLPIDRFSNASGVQLRGQILDYETHRGIPGVTVIIIGTEFSVAEFQWQQNQVYASATTDSQGNFIIDRPLELSTESQPIAYSAVVAAYGYLPLSADGIEVNSDSPNPTNILLYLSRD